MEAIFSGSRQKTKFIFSRICYLHLQVKPFSKRSAYSLGNGIDQSELSTDDLSHQNLVTKYFIFKFDFYCAVYHTILSGNCPGKGSSGYGRYSYHKSQVRETLIGTGIYGSRLQHEWCYFQSFLLRRNHLQNHRTGFSTAYHGTLSITFPRVMNPELAESSVKQYFLTATNWIDIMSVTGIQYTRQMQ